MSDNFSEKVLAASFGCSIIIHCLMYGSSAQFIEEATENFARELYETDRDLVIVITRSQKLMKITALVYTMDLPTVLTILQGAGSLITALKSFVK
jgi:hypothetical protein